MSLANKALAGLVVVLLVAMLLLSGYAYLEHKRVNKLVDASVTQRADITSLKVKVSSMERVRKEQGVKNAKLEDAVSRHQDWAEQPVPDDVADSLR